MTIDRVRGKWILNGQAYDTRKAALAGDKPLTPIEVGPLDPIDWDDVVRQQDPAEVPAAPQDEPFVVHTQWGEVLQGQPGDWLVGRGTDQWVVGPEEFAATYFETRPGHFVKTGWALTRQMSRPFRVDTREGWVEGHAGDHLMQGPLGDRWRVARSAFAAKGYVPVEELADDVPGSPVPYPDPASLRWVRQSDGSYRRGRERVIKVRPGKWRRGDRTFPTLRAAKAEQRAP